MTSTDPQAVGQRIATARRRRGLSQAVLAGLVGRSESWLSQVERGKRRVDSHTVLTRVADLLRTDIAELAGTDGGETATGDFPLLESIKRAMMGYDALDAVIATGSRHRTRQRRSCGRWSPMRTGTTKPPVTSRPGGASSALSATWKRLPVSVGTQSS
jgi:transcriptional regulator with XRE-family HTH domain